MKKSAVETLADGWRQFCEERFPSLKQLYAKLSTGQDPKVLFITCADSRVDPSFIFQTEPGELFISRNPGNLVPPYGALLGGASASLEYALTALSVEDIVVCGHSNCGAMKGILDRRLLANMPVVAAWLRYGEAALSAQRWNSRSPSHSRKIELLTKENTLVQIDNLKTYPAVVGRLARGTLRLHAWYYDIPTGGISCFDPERQIFLPLAPERQPACSARPRLGRKNRR